jgi:hypothetical protein
VRIECALEEEGGEGGDLTLDVVIDTAIGVDGIGESDLPDVVGS